MAALRRVLQSSVPRTLLRRNITVSSAVQGGHGGYQEYQEIAGTTFDESNPAQLVRQEVDAALAAKEKGPWGDLSKEDKIALYRSQFVTSMAEEVSGPSDTPNVFFGVSALLGVGILFFVFLKKYVGPTPPYTFTPEWREAQEEKMKLFKMNPITGISSK